MVNVEKFIKRLELILDYYSLTASSFADKISVQRSSLSHLLSGRNKPSLEFIMKIIDEFPEVTLEWIVYGNGKFPKEEIVYQEQVKIEKPIIASNKIENSRTLKNEDLLSDSITEDNKILPSKEEEIILSQTPSTPSKNSAIERIVIFYSNGTFKNYNP
jgi:transcriptional regulator with XRE-family HTH domain